MTTNGVRPWLRSIEAAAVAGMVYALLAVVGITLLSRSPDLDLTDDELTAWYDAGSGTALVLGVNLIAISAIAFLWFVAVVRRRVGDRQDHLFGTVFLSSAVAFVAAWLSAAAATASPAIAVTVLDGASVTTATVSTANGLGAAFLLVVAPRMSAVFILSTSTLIRRTGVLPAWLGIVGLVTAATMMFVPIVTEPIGFVFPCWVLLVSVVILVVRPQLGARPGKHR
jgi:hypothetical protein